MTIKIILLVVFFAITVCIGLYCRKHATDVDGFVLGGRKVGPWLSAFAYGTSYFSAVIFIGYAGQFGWKYGVAATWIGLGNAFIGSLLAWWILGRRTRLMTQRLEARTMPEFFGRRYDSKALRIASSALIFVFLIPYTASAFNGLSRLFGMAFNIPYEYCVIAMAVFTCIYVVLGGYMATVLNDTFQGGIMLVGIIAVIIAVLNGQGGFTAALTELSTYVSDTSATAGLQGAYVSFFGPDFLGLMGVVVLTSLGVWGLPQMVQKFYAIKSEKDIRTGGIVSTAFALVVAGGSYFLGSFGRLFGDQIAYTSTGTPVYDSIVPTMLSGLPDLLVGLTVVLVLSASMSTLSALVLSSSSTLTIDVIKDNVIRDMSQKQQLVCMRVLLVLFVIVSAAVALLQYHSAVTFIAQLMSISWGALAGAFLGPFLYGLYWKRTSKAAVWACFVWGVGLTVSNMFIGFIASPINAGAIAILGSLVIVPLVSLFTPRMDAAKVDYCFEELHEHVSVPRSHALTDED